MLECTVFPTSVRLQMIRCCNQQGTFPGLITHLCLVLRCRVNFGDFFQGKRNTSYEAGNAVAVSGLLKSIFLRIKMFTSLTAVISCNFALLYIKKVRNVLLQ